MRGRERVLGEPDRLRFRSTRYRGFAEEPGFDLLADKEPPATDLARWKGALACEVFDGAVGMCGSSATSPTVNTSAALSGLTRGVLAELLPDTREHRWPAGDRPCSLRVWS